MAFTDDNYLERIQSIPSIFDVRAVVEDRRGDVERGGRKRALPVVPLPPRHKLPPKPAPAPPSVFRVVPNLALIRPPPPKCFVMSSLPPPAFAPTRAPPALAPARAPQATHAASSASALNASSPERPDPRTLRPYDADLESSDDFDDMEAAAVYVLGAHPFERIDLDPRDPRNPLNLLPWDVRDRVSRELQTILLARSG